MVKLIMLGLISATALAACENPAVSDGARQKVVPRIAADRRDQNAAKDTAEIMALKAASEKYDGQAALKRQIESGSNLVQANRPR